MEQQIYADSNWSMAQKIVILYVQEFIFKFIITLSAFIALFAGTCVLSSIQSISTISTGAGALLIFLFIWGVIGVTGYLTHLIVAGKVPGGK
jgi:ABC-type iron transport system FetAB permease component